MKKEKKGKQEAQEITICYAQGKMIFQIGDQKFYLSEEVANFLFGRNVQLQQDDDSHDFDELRTIENLVRIQRLLRKGLNLPQIAKVLNRPEEHVRQFYSRERARPQVESFNVNSLEIERQKQAAQEVDYVKEAPRSKAINEIEPPEPAERFVHLQDVKNLLNQGKSAEQIADHLNLDRKSFEQWLKLNSKYLDLLP